MSLIFLKGLNKGVCTSGNYRNISGNYRNIFGNYRDICGNNRESSEATWEQLDRIPIGLFCFPFKVVVLCFAVFVGSWSPLNRSGLSLSSHAVSDQTVAKQPMDYSTPSGQGS